MRINLISIADIVNLLDFEFETLCELTCHTYISAFVNENVFTE